MKDYNPMAWPLNIVNAQLLNNQIFDILLNLKFRKIACNIYSSHTKSNAM